jgi:protein dithiol oxidoreductase (disulfide-forming)
MRDRCSMAMRLIFCWLALACAAMPAAAQQLQRDVDYRLIPQQPLTTGDRIEVIDFFFYACPYCNELEPHLARWQKQIPADVVLRRVPVVRHDSWAPLAKAYFALEAMGAAERLHAAAYRGYHDDNLPLGQEQVVAEWVQKQGLDREKFLAIYRSDDIRAKVERARQMTRDYDIQGTPTIVVDGRFLTSSGMTPTVPEVIPVIDGLVRLARQQRNAKSAQ